MVLLRNRFFKSCCFNTNLQQWFKDNNITQVSQLNGFTLAENIEDIKMVTTPSSIKYEKFGEIETWLQTIDPDFGVVKYDKETQYIGGEMVQTHYQLLNTLQLSRDDVEELVTPTFDFVSKLKNDPSVMRYYLTYPYEYCIDDIHINTKNEMVWTMLGINDMIVDTKYYHSFCDETVSAYYKNAKKGHILVDGNYSTLLGNPIELLKFAIGQFDGESQIGVGNIHSSRFGYNQKILCTRSPHVCMGNIWLPENKENEEIDKYFNLTDQIVCINSIGENVLQKLNGADFDSDTVMMTDNPILIRAAEKNYSTFKTPTSFVVSQKRARTYTPQQQADLDIKTSVNKIGEIINLAQVLTSLYWNLISNGIEHKDLVELYCDICTLAVMSGIEIDKAKKEYELNVITELKIIREKYSDSLINKDTNKKILPFFFSHISKQKGYYDPERKD